MKKIYDLELPEIFRRYGLIFFMVFLFQFSQAQVYYDTICWVWVNDAAYAAVQGTDFSSKSDLNTLFDQDQVVYYEQALPFAKTPELLTIHEIRCSGNGDIDNVIADLKNTYPLTFDKFSKFEVMDSVYVYDPIDWMWVSHADDWLWHLKRIQADYAWDITRGDPNIFTAIIDADFDVTHPDLASEISPHYDPYTNYQYSCNTTHWHGSAVASFVSAETTEQGGTPQGQLASVGFNTKIVAYMWANRQNTLAKALHASNVMGADVFVSCAGGSLNCSPDPSTGEELIVKEILDNGTVIVMPAGNGPNSTSCGPPGNQHAFYPFNPEYDERIIIVTSTDFDDNHYWENDQGEEYTHSHFPEVDICAPGYDIMGAATTECGGNTWPYYGNWGGTSFSSPIVAGVVSLIKSINKDFTPGEIQEMIKRTADPIADGQNYQGLIGAGRINAFAAVDLAANCTPEVITGIETWNDDRVILCGLIVEDGAELTIQGTVKLSHMSNIIVKPGGKLIIYGGTLTSLDNKLWQGVEVWGNPQLSQIPANQGWLSISNGGTIENAVVAVKAGTGDFGAKGGGIVHASEAF
ncbi:MAG: S8/S53 family peptidase, partial [Bacteroidales bacterium]|nr:S8/S53 family peptidase [Bacteroidales bacterium]